MRSWVDLAEQQPDLARFGAQLLTAKPAYLATLRADGVPRVHPVTPVVAPSGLFVFMEPASPKGRDLRERQWYSIHAGVPDNQGTGGEFTVTGRGRPVDDAAVRAEVVAAASYTPADRYVLFELLVGEARCNGYGDVELPATRRWSGADPVVRRLTGDDDLERFGQIVFDTYRAMPGHPADPGYDAQLRDVTTRARRGTVFGAFVEGRPAGCVTFVADASSEHAEGLREGESSFRMLAVDAAAQGHGVGEALVRRCLDEARIVGSSAVFIYTGSWMSTAHRLYRRLGFVRTPGRDWIFQDPPLRLLGFVRSGERDAR